MTGETKYGGPPCYILYLHTSGGPKSRQPLDHLTIQNICSIFYGSECASMTQ